MPHALRLRLVLTLALCAAALSPRIASADSGDGSSGLFTSNGEKSGRFMANLKIGPAFLAYPTYDGVTLVQAALTLEFGVALTPDRNGYLIFPVGFQMSSGSAFISIPVGFQYDIPLPVKGLYLTPRASIGYTAIVASDTVCNAFGCTSTTAISHAGIFNPEIGIKYIYRGRFNFGFDPFSLPIYFGAPATSCSIFGCSTAAQVAVFYRLLFYAGANF